MPFHHIVSAAPHASGVLSVTFASGETRLFDVRPYMRSDFFRQLEDEAYFAQVRAMGNTVTWPNGQDFDPGVVYVRSVPPEDGSGRASSDGGRGVAPTVR